MDNNLKGEVLKRQDSGRMNAFSVKVNPEDQKEKWVQYKSVGCKTKMRTAIVTEAREGATAIKIGTMNGRTCSREATENKVWEQEVKINNEKLSIERQMRKYFSLKKFGVQERGRYHGNIKSKERKGEFPLVWMVWHEYVWSQHPMNREREEAGQRGYDDLAGCIGAGEDGTESR